MRIKKGDLMTERPRVYIIDFGLSRRYQHSNGSIREVKRTPVI